jgi:hypothetical protein
MAFGKVNKEANTKIAMKSLTDKGWTRMQAAAIIGNLTAESYMNPNTPRGDGGTAMGLAQWRFERLDKFEEIIGKHCEDASLEEQLRFVDWELRNTHKKAGSLLKAAPDIEVATAAVDKYYERSAGHHLERRIKFAREALEKYGRPEEKELNEQLEVGIEDSMDASDPLTATQPGNTNDPVPSSGFPEKPASIWQRLLNLILLIFKEKK